ncbi:unnamed protein product, partial [Phaeothamnion confervicola]
HGGVTNAAGVAALAAALAGRGGAASSGGCGGGGVAADGGPTAVAFAPMDWDAYVDLFPAAKPLLSRLLRVDGCGGPNGGRGGFDSAAPMNRDEVTCIILETAVEVMGSGGADLVATTDLTGEGGMDSLEALEFRRLLLGRLGLSGAAVPTTLLYDCPSPLAMAERLCLMRASAAASASALSAVAVPAAPVVLERRRLGKGEAAASMGGAAATMTVVPAPPSRAAAGTAATVASAAAGVAAAEEPWEEEGNLDNIFYLLYKLARAVAAYLYMAAVVTIPGWVFFHGAAIASGGGGGPVVDRLLTLFGAASSGGGADVVAGPVMTVLVVLPALWIAYGAVLCALVVASKWMLVGRLAPGTRFATHSWLHLRWWVVQRLMSFCGVLFVDEIRRTRFVVWYYRALGCRLGRDVFLNTNRIHDPDMIALGDGTVVNEHAIFKGHSLRGNVITLAPVRLGAAVVVMPSAIVGGGGAAVDVPAGRIVDSLCTDAHPTRRNPAAAGVAAELAAVHGAARQLAVQVGGDLFGLWVVAVAVGIAAYPAFLLLSALLAAQGVCPPAVADSAAGQMPHLAESGVAFAAFAGVFLVSRLYLPLAPAFAGAAPGMALACVRAAAAGPGAVVVAALSAGTSAATFAVLLMAVSILIKWTLVGRIRPTDPAGPGLSALTTYGIAKQASDRIIMSAMMRAVLMFNGGLGNALWLRLLGCRAGTRLTVMLNKNIYTEAELLDFGEDVHIGFASSTYCCLWTTPTRCQLRAVTAGDRALVGAGSVMLPGATIPAGAALGPNTRLTVRDAMRSNALHVGCPGSPAPVAVATYRPPARALTAWERVLYIAAPLPLAALAMACIALAALPALAAMAILGVSWGSPVACWAAPAVYLLFGTSLALASAALKWTTIGQQRPGVVRLWSPYHHRTLLVLVVQAAAHFLFVDLLRAGACYAWYCRLMGATIG